MKTFRISNYRAEFYKDNRQVASLIVQLVVGLFA